LSKAGGGELEHHASHESGRDADVGFYVKGASGRPVQSDDMVAFRGDGSAQAWPGARFDDARNWALVEALLSDNHGSVSHIFVARPIRDRLLSFAAKVGASGAVRARAAEVLVQPRGALPHDDHFHVRIACPAGMDRCIEQPIAKRGLSAHEASVARARSHGAGKSGSGRGSGVAHLARKDVRDNDSAGSKTRAEKEDVEANQARSASRGPCGKPSGSGGCGEGEGEAARARQRARDESDVPNFTPAVAGFGSVVIAAPLGASEGKSDTPVPVQPKAPAISDPDGVIP